MRTKRRREKDMGMMEGVSRIVGRVLRPIHAGQKKLASQEPKLQEPKVAGTSSRIDVTSPAFGQGERIPVKFTPEGENVSPPLRWSDVPSQTRELVLIVEDPD